MRQRPTLPGRLQPSTIGVLRLNFCVRNGNRWNPQAITTAKCERCKVIRRTVLMTFIIFSIGSQSPAGKAHFLKNFLMAPRRYFIKSSAMRLSCPAISLNAQFKSNVLTQMRLPLIK